MAFEQLMAEAAKKQEKRKDKEAGVDRKKEKEHAGHQHMQQPLGPSTSTSPTEEMSEAEERGRAHLAGQEATGRR